MVVVVVVAGIVEVVVVVVAPGIVVVVVVEVDVVEVEDVELVELVDVEEVEDVEEVDVEEVDVEELVDVEVEVDEEVVVTRLTSGPLAEQLTSARTISTTPSRLPRPGSTVMCAPRTWMLVLPTALEIVCSLSVTSRMPGRVSSVLAAGEPRIGLPPRTPPTISVKPEEPSPFDVHWVSMASMAREPRPTRTSATLARAWEKAL